MLTQLLVKNFRNIPEANLDGLSPHLNLFYGQNGSGKTSVLEAIHLLTRGKSFRTNNIQRLIKEETDACVVSALCDHPRVRIGTSRHKDGTKLLKMADQNIRNISEITSLLPLQILHSESFDLFNAGPSYRRKVLDWGVFHVEHNYLSAWKDYNRCLKQRNMLLKNAKIVGLQQLDMWNKQLIQLAADIDAYRTKYFELLLAEFKQLAELETDFQAELSYYPGWNQKMSFSEVLEANLDKDKERGFTQAGPHRCDLRLKVNNAPAHEYLSRGQLKRFLIFIMTAQIALLKQLTNKKTAFLLDDLPAELDGHSGNLIKSLLIKHECQLFITGIERERLIEGWKLEKHQNVKMFHVEHGTITETN